MKTIPNYGLYGSEAQPVWIDLVHFERIVERASLYNWEIAPHFHDALFQVLYLGGGSGEAVVDETKWPLLPHSLIVVPARSVHSFRFSSDTDGPVVTAAQRPLESVASAAAPQLLRHIRSPRVYQIDPSNRHADALMPLFEAIERESRVDAPGQMAAGMSLLVALFVQIARIGASTQSPEGAARSRKAAQLERFRALVDAHYKHRRPVESYADELGLSLGQLTRLCREVLGMSSLDVVNVRVVHEAQRELVYSSLSIKQIAGLLGFDDEAYFGRFFKKQTGQRPTEFRETARRQLASA